MKTFIYCTKAKPYLSHTFALISADNEISYFELLDKILRERYEIRNILNGKVVACCDINEVDLIVNNGSNFMVDNDIAKTNLIAKQSCLYFVDMQKYLKDKNGYALHLENVEPVNLELNEFLYSCDETKHNCEKCKWFERGYYDDHECTCDQMRPIDFNIQSFCYAYYKGERVLIISVQSKWVEKILNGEKTIEIRKVCPREVLK